MSISEKINSYLLRKMAKSKVQHLFAVSKKHLFSLIHELSEKNEKLEADKEKLYLTIDTFRDEFEELQKENEKLKSTNEQKINTAITRLEAHKGINYELAYKDIKRKAETIIEENKGVKDTLEVASNVVYNTKRQNEYLKEQLKIVKTQNERLSAENKKFREKEKEAAIELDKNVVELKKGHTVSHNFNKIGKNNNENRSKKVLITRQVNN